MGKVIDLTSKVEKLEITEKKYGVHISGMYCSVEANNYSDDVSYEVKCNGEITGEEILTDIAVKCTAYDDKERVLGEDSKYFSRGTFSKFDTFVLCFNINSKPAKCKLFIIKS